MKDRKNEASTERLKKKKIKIHIIFKLKKSKCLISI